MFFLYFKLIEFNKKGTLITSRSIDLELRNNLIMPYAWNVALTDVRQGPWGEVIQKGMVLQKKNTKQ